MIYTLSGFDYHLPEELTAQSPASPRYHAPLLVYNRAISEISDDYFYNLGKYLHPQTRLVVNNSKVKKYCMGFLHKAHLSELKKDFLLIFY